MSPKKKKEETKPKPIDLKLTLENFGPLRKAEVELKPMTIFIGPNNSGKSYVAMMFYSLFRSYWHVDPGPPIYPPEAADEETTKQLNPWRFIQRPFCEDALMEFLGQHGPLGRAAKIGIPRELLLRVAHDIFQEVSLGVLVGQISDIYDASLKELGRMPGRAFQLVVTAGDWRADLKCENDELTIVNIDPGPQIKEIPLRFAVSTITGDQLKEAGLQGRSELAILGHSVASEALRPFWQRLDRGHFYLPAQRSSWMQTFLDLIQDRIGSMTHIPREPGKQPVMMGTGRWFLRHLAEVSRQGLGPLSERLARDMETDLIRGEILLRAADEKLLPAFYYRFSEGEIPLHRASSSVSELAPLFLYTKYFLHPACILIIDEPEAHLHPGAIRVLAKYLVRLVREGVNLIITTHSDYLFGQINNYMLAGNLRQKGAAKEMKGDSEVYLDSSEVACYLFKAGDSPEEGFSTEELKAEEEGFPEREFTQVARAMYNQSVKLRTQMIPEKRLGDVAKG